MPNPPSNRIGVLPVNVGTPRAPHSREVRRYLREFLGDPRVFDVSPALRWFLLNFVILPFRPRRSAEAYEKVWTPEGSPLLVHGRRFEGLTGVGTFLVRLVFPVDWNFSLLNLQFPFFVLYIAMFIVGLLAYRRNWLLGLPDAQGKLWLGISIALILLFVPLALIGGAMENDQPFKGGLNWQAMAYAQWEAFLCMGMCIGLIYLFRRYLNRQGRLAKFLVPNAYIAYIIHAQVITAMALVLRNVDLYPLLKFGLVALIGVSLSFVLGNLIRKLPYADRVL